LVDLIQPYVKSVSDFTGESCSVSVLDLPDIVYIARSLTHQIMSVSLNVGTRLPALYTSMGRMLLAEKSDAEISAFIEAHPPEKLTAYTLMDPGEILKEVRKCRDDGYS